MLANFTARSLGRPGGRPLRPGPSYGKRPADATPSPPGARRSEVADGLGAAVRAQGAVGGQVDGAADEPDGAVAHREVRPAGVLAAERRGPLGAVDAPEARRPDRVRRQAVVQLVR